MTLNWKSFQIDLVSFNSWLKVNLSKADGIVAGSSNFTIIEKEEFTQEEQNLVMDYYNTLNVDVESAKIMRPEKLSEAYLNCRSQLIEKPFDALNTLEKKLILGIPFTTQEEDELIEAYGETI